MEIDTELKRRVIKRLVDARVRLLIRSPFYGNLVMHLKFALASCGTAATNMRKIIFDPKFVDSIGDDELDFVLMHEVLHCALNHCIRGNGRNQYFFNIACDIVVNSNIMASLGVNDFTVDGAKAMHKTPDDIEGRLLSAEEVYDKLMDKYQALIRDVNDVISEVENDYGVCIDKHDIWKSVPLDDSLSDEWKKHVIDAAKKAGGDTPPVVRKLLDDYSKESAVNWKEVLHDFIKVINDKHDYSFVPPDRRFSTGDFILPGLYELNSDKVEKLWFLIDSSGSISAQMLTDAFNEIRAAITQFEYLSGSLSFFDTKVTDPVEFESIDDLLKITPVGGGGTSFYNIFSYMKSHMTDELPTAIIILTDGYATYPKEEMALGVPVLWIINNDEKAPWGTTVNIKE